MRILLVGPVPPELGSSNYGGVARHVWDLARALQRRGHDVEVLALGRYFRTTRQINNIIVHGISFGAPQKLPRLLLKYGGFVSKVGSKWSLKEYLHLLYSCVRLSSVIGRSFSVVHAHGYSQKVPIACSLLKESAPSILTVHSYSDVYFGDNKGKIDKYNMVNRKTDALIHVSRSDRQRGKKNGAKWICPDFVIHNAVNVDGYNFYENERSGVCFMGGLTHRKGLDILVKAWKQCSGIEPLRIVGKGSLSEAVEELAVQNSSVNAMGYLEKRKALQQMRRANALVVPSRSESFGLVYLEALLLGTPVVGYHRTLKEFISLLSLTKEEQGYIHPYDATNESVSRLSDLIEQAVATRQKDKNGRIARSVIRKVRDYFSWDRIIPKIESVYEQVASSQSKL